MLSLPACQVEGSEEIYLSRFDSPTKRKTMMFQMDKIIQCYEAQCNQFLYCFTPLMCFVGNIQRGNTKRMRKILLS